MNIIFKKLIILIISYFVILKVSGQNIIIDSIYKYSDTVVPQYSKFELGVHINKYPNVDIHNKYDYSEIRIFGVFRNSLGEVDTVDGFWYQPFSICNTCYNPSNLAYPFSIDSFDFVNSCGGLNNRYNELFDVTGAYYNRMSTNFPWRIRFATGALGNWQYKLYVWSKNYGSDSSSVSQILISNSSDKGYIKIASNKRNFCFGDDSIFIPLGVNVISIQDTPVPYNNRVPYLAVTKLINHLSTHGGNFLRIWSSPDNFNIEWEKDSIGNYDAKQNKSFELDNIFDSAELYNVYLQFTNGSHDVDSFWGPSSPYSKFINDPPNFFSNDTCLKYFENRYRYILARWGYSSHLVSIEFMQEIEGWSTHNLYINQRSMWNSSIHDSVYNWYQTMIRYCKNINKHVLYTVSFQTEDGNAWDNYPGYNPSKIIFAMPELDFISGHDYRGIYNLNSNRGYIANKNRVLFPSKPFFLQEFGTSLYGANIGLVNNYNPIFNANDWHTGIWSTAFMNSSGPGLFWIGDGFDVTHDKNGTNGCWGGQDLHFKILNNFLKNEPIFYKPYIAISNPCTGTGIKDTCSNSDNDIVSNRCNCHFHSDTTQFLNYVIGGVQTTNDSLIEVFALKYFDRIVGWVHNKQSYWYNLPRQYHDSANSIVSLLIDDNGMNNGYGDCIPNDSVIHRLIADSLIIQHISPGNYNIDFYSTYPDFPISFGGSNVNGGKIDTFAIKFLHVGCDSILKFQIPELAPLTWGDSLAPYAPDYGFKVYSVNTEVPDTIFSNTTWNTNLTLANALITVNTGATLTIQNDTINMPYFGIIQVLNGGKLIINNAVITRDDTTCNEFWGGIIASGDHYFGQLTSNTGWVTINNSVIKNSRFGLRDWDFNGYHGGIIQANNSTFLNNIISADFSDYFSMNNTLSVSYPDKSYFTNCNFIVDNSYLGNNYADTFECMIHAYHVMGVKVNGCSFDNRNTVSNIFGTGYGIKTFDAGMNLQGICNGISSPSGCSNLQLTTFKGFREGVHIDGTGTFSLNPEFKIDQSQFDSCGVGVRVVNMNSTSTTRSIFNVGGGNPVYDFDSMSCHQNIGILTENSNHFKIEENIFHGIQNTSYSDWNNFGVVIENSGWANNIIYRDSFSGLNFACYSRGVNSQPFQYATLQTGLQFLCNTFYNDSFDIYISGDYSYYSLIHEPSIRDDQGGSNPDSPANNYFASQGRIYNGGYSFTYFYDSTDTTHYKPLVFPANSFIVEGTGPNGSCPSSYAINNSYLISTLNSSQIADIKTSYFNSISNHLALTTTYDSLMDGGSTDGLISMINITPDSIILFNNLNSISPYLSSNVLKYLSIDSILSKHQYFNILLANPESLRENALILDLVQNSPYYTFNDSEKNAVKSAALISTPRTYLEGQINAEENNLINCSNKLLFSMKAAYDSCDNCNIVTDSTSVWYGLDSNLRYIYLDSLQPWLQNIETMWGRYDLLGYYNQFDPHDTSHLADSALAHAYQYVTTDNPFIDSEYLNYETLWNVLKGAQTANRNIYQLNSSEISTLNSILDTITSNKASTIAHSIINASVIEYPIPCMSEAPPYSASRQNNHKGNSTGSTGNTGGGNNESNGTIFRDNCSIVAFPNPSTNLVTFRYSVPYNTQNLSISITDVIGKAIVQIPISSNEGLVNWNCLSNSAGIYYYSLYDSRGVIGNGKIVLIK